ncbi:MAG: hypothetical protein IIC78_10525 [Chloroflexi bacterium]|nr:hypothetical protein [Chloroflexota bacterium]
MRFRGNVFGASVAFIVGVIVLLGYFFTSPLLGGVDIRQLLIQWAAIIAAAALFLGLINLFTVHWNKVNDQTQGWPYSAVLIFFFLVTIVLGVIFGPDFEVMNLLFNYIQLPIEAGLIALLAITLAYAGFRFISHRKDVFSVVFVSTALLVLMGNSPWLLGSDSTLAALMANLRAWIVQVWSVAGARGIILGVALGATTTGLRVILGADRPYGD